MNLVVNGKTHTHVGNGSIEALLDEIGAKKNHTALMVNGAVISSNDWETATLKENDQIEMLVFVGGG
ncbi:MAG: sulfur carrier protein ThiS [Kiritimatiellaceae bacterium]|nr:sulfur carrier protein ThiS [Kiritimatiellaceae bacterium]